jgi:DNA-binding CsgD family transcriptional regulator
MANNFALLMITVFFVICALFAPLRRFYLACTSWLLQLPDLEPVPGPKAVGYVMLVLVIHMVLGMVFIDLVFWGFYVGFLALAVAITGDPMTVAIPFTSANFVLEDRIINGIVGVLCLVVTLWIAPFLASGFGRLFRQLAANPAFGDLKKPVTAYPGLDLLTDRERETLDLLAHGMSNRQIAKELVISEETAKSYVAAILNKLDVENRTQAAVIAVRYELEHTPSPR